MRICNGVVFFLFLILGCAPKERYINEIDIVEQQGQSLYYFDDSPFSGRIIDDSATARSSTYSVKEGRLNGPTTHRNLAGQKLLVENYSLGKLDGLVVSYFDNGLKRSSAQYINGKKNGQHLLYYPSGGLSKVLFYKDGALSGDNFLYYKDGKLQHHFHFNRLGQRHGLWEKFYSNGKRKEKITYDQGILLPPIQRFSIDGKLITAPRSD